jgi:hypothetical protein
VVRALPRAIPELRSQALEPGLQAQAPVLQLRAPGPAVKAPGLEPLSARLHLPV